jgi:hypothetical protein
MLFRACFGKRLEQKRQRALESALKADTSHLSLQLGWLSQRFNGNSLTSPIRELFNSMLALFHVTNGANHGRNRSESA